MWEDYAKDPANAHDWQQTYMKFMFDLEDSSGRLIKVTLLNENNNKIKKEWVTEGKGEKYPQT